MTNQPDSAPPDDSTADLGATSDNSINLTQEQADAVGITDPKPGDTYTITLNVSDTSMGVTATIMDGSAERTSAPGKDDMGAGEPDETDDNPTPLGDEDDDENGDEANNVANPDLAVKPATPSAKRKSKMRVLSPSEAGFSGDGLDMK